MRRCVLMVTAMAVAAACTRTRTVKLAWDPPAMLPDRYHVFVDTRLVLDIPPPPIDQSCTCLRTEVKVSSGQHTIRLDACNHDGVCTPSPELIVR
jgi:hypothetical protein